MFDESWDELRWLGGWPVSMLGSGLEELQATLPDDVPADDLLDRVSESLAALERLTALLARDAEAVGRREAFRRDGYTSTTAMLKHAGRMTAGRARQLAGLGSLFTEAPATAAAWLEGTLSTDQVRVLAAARAESPEMYAEHERRLVEAVAGLSVTDTRRAVEYWRQQAIPDARAGAETLREQRRLHASRSLDGMVRIDGLADPESGEWILTMLEAGIGPPTAEDTRTPGQRRLDVLVDAARGYLDAAAGGSAGRPHVMVHVDAATLASRTGGGLHETGAGTVLAAETVRRICCDAVLTRVVFGDDGRVLDLGTSVRTVPGWLRRAVIARDRQCVFTGCDRPPAWCDAHHLIHPGGPTSLDWLVLLCRYHHTLVHQHGFRIRGPAHRLVITRPDGTILDERTGQRRRTPARASPLQE